MNNSIESFAESREKKENNVSVIEKTPDLEKDYNNLINLLEQNQGKSKFIVDLWKKYLSQKKISFEKDIQDCYKVINILNETNTPNSITNIDALSYETIVLLKATFME